MDKKELEIFKKRTNELLAALDKIKQNANTHIERAHEYDKAITKVDAVIQVNNDLASQIKNVTEKIDEYVAGLYDLGSEKMIEEITQFNNSTKLLRNDLKIIPEVAKEFENATKSMKDVVAANEETMKMVESFKTTIRALEKSLSEQWAMDNKILPLLEELSTKIEKTDTVLVDVRSENQKLREENIALRESMTKLLKKIEEASDKKGGGFFRKK